MIANIQLLRAFAAMAVVFYHTAFVLPGGAHTEFQGVGIFFVISGFIISHVAGDSPASFFYRRTVRIVPLYWIATSTSIFWFGTKSSNRVGMLIAVILLYVAVRVFLRYEKKYIAARYKSRHFLVICLMALCLSAIVLYPAIEWMRGTGRYSFLIKSFLFLPALDINGRLQPFLGIGWTLNLEMFFYVVFATTLFSGRRLAPLLTSFVLILMVVLYKTGVFSNIYFAFYSHEYVLFFILGMMLNYAYLYFENKVVPKKLSILTLSIGVIYLFLYNLVPGSLSPFLKGPLVYVATYTGPTLVVGGALLCHLAGIRCNWSSIIVFGNASYALYLLHPMIIETLRPLVSLQPVLDFSMSVTGVLVVFLLALPVSLASYTFLEHPIQGGLRDLGKCTVDVFFPPKASSFSR